MLKKPPFAKSPLSAIHDLARAGRHVPGAPDRVFKLVTAVCLGAFAFKMVMDEIGKGYYRQ